MYYLAFFSQLSRILLQDWQGNFLFFQLYSGFFSKYPTGIKRTLSHPFYCNDTFNHCFLACIIPKQINHDSIIVKRTVKRFREVIKNAKPSLLVITNGSCFSQNRLPGIGLFTHPVLTEIRRSLFRISPIGRALSVRWLVGPWWSCWERWKCIESWKYPRLLHHSIESWLVHTSRITFC